MFKKTRIVITTLDENAQIWVATQLMALHIKFIIIGEANAVDTKYDMKVSEKQLSNVIKWIVPRTFKGDVKVRMIIKNNIVTLATV